MMAVAGQFAPVVVDVYGELATSNGSITWPTRRRTAHEAAARLVTASGGLGAR